VKDLSKPRLKELILKEVAYYRYNKKKRILLPSFPKIRIVGNEESKQ
jgi:hypothetical protein